MVETGILLVVSREQLKASGRSETGPNAVGGRAAPWRRRAGGLLAGALLLLVAFYAGRALLFSSQGPVRLVVYAFSTQAEVLSQGIFPAFEATWEAGTGRDLTIEGVFGPSGTLASQINLGAPADVAVLSNEQHVTWLKVGRCVDAATQPVLVSYTPMVIAGRPGWLDNVHEFADLAGVSRQLLHADPRMSGAGSWAVLAEYGSALQVSGDPALARSQLEAIWDQVRFLAPSARAMMTLFELGAGDVIITYEQDARLAQDRGVDLVIVVPSYTILAQHVAVIVDDNVTRAERPAAEAFIRYLLSDAGQQAFRQYHLRPAASGGDRPPDPARAFTVQDLGGWARAYQELVDGLWLEGIAPNLQLTPAVGLPGDDP